MVEQIRPGVTAKGARFVLFDFDGTVSLIRSGWVDVMVPMMVEILADLKTGEDEAQLTAIVEDFVGRLTGQQTMYQMIELAGQVEIRGGQPLDPLEYKKAYLARLHDKIRYRLEELRNGDAPPEKYLVPGARPMIEALAGMGLTMYLASGTDQEYMREEARLLDVDRYFGGGVFGALDDFKSFSKKILIQQVIASSGCRGEIFGFGDGYVEIENVKEVEEGGGWRPPSQKWQVDEWKRRRLPASARTSSCPTSSATGTARLLFPQ
jgi:phosphoserine phosphatase